MLTPVLAANPVRVRAARDSSIGLRYDSKRDAAGAPVLKRIGELAVRTRAMPAVASGFGRTSAFKRGN